MAMQWFLRSNKCEKFIKYGGQKPDISQSENLTRVSGELKKVYVRTPDTSQSEKLTRVSGFGELKKVDVHCEL